MNDTMGLGIRASMGAISTMPAAAWLPFCLATAIFSFAMADYRVIGGASCYDGSRGTWGRIERKNVKHERIDQSQGRSTGTNVWQGRVVCLLHVQGNEDTYQAPAYCRGALNLDKPENSHRPVPGRSKWVSARYPD